MNTVPQVSVIIPVYNVESYLQECLDSVIDQTLKNIEIICINDGSTDRSLEILNAYAQLDNRIQVYTQSNQGLSKTRNVGISKAVGEYILFLDSDDKIKLNTLEVTYQQAVQDKLDILYFDGEVIYENIELERRCPNYKTYYVAKCNVDGVVTGVDMLERFLRSRTDKVQVSVKLIRNSLLITHNLKFKENMLHEDHLFSFELICSAKRVSLMNTSFFQYRVREGSIMTTKKSFANFYGCFMSSILLYDFIQKLLLEQHKKAVMIKEPDELMKIGIQRFNQLSKEEQENIYNLNQLEQHFFQIFVLPHCPDFDYLPLKIDALNLEINQLFRRNEVAKAEIEAVYLSFTYEVGRQITLLPRIVKRMMAYTQKSSDVTSKKPTTFVWNTNTILQELEKMIHKLASCSEKDKITMNQTLVLKFNQNEPLIQAICNQLKDGNEEILDKLIQLNRIISWNLLQGKKGFENQFLLKPLSWYVELKKYESHKVTETQRLQHTIQKLTKRRNDLRNELKRHQKRIQDLRKSNSYQIGSFVTAGPRKWNGMLKRYINRIHEPKLPKISVIIPVYNVEVYLPRCVQSIVNQDYNNLQIILVDDGSTDNSGILCDEYARKYANITVIHQANSGVSSARNAGMKIAKGAYVSFIDSDDFIHPQTYSTAVHAFQLNPEIDLVEWAIQISNEEIMEYEALSFQPINSVDLEIHNRSDFMFELIQYRKHKQNVCNTLFKKSLISKIEFLDGKFAEDVFFTNDYVTKVQKVAYLPQKLYFYYKRSGSTMNSSTTMKFVDDIDGFYQRHLIIKEQFPQFVELSLKVVLNLIYRRLQDIVMQDRDLDEAMRMATVTRMITYYYDDVMKSEEIEQHRKDDFTLAKKDINAFIKQHEELLIKKGIVPKKQRKKILFLTNFLDVKGGVEVVIRDYCALLNKDKFEIVIFLQNYSYDTLADSLKEIVDFLQVEIVSLPQDGTNQKDYFANYLKNHLPDVIHVHKWSFGMLYSNKELIKNVKLFATIHTNPKAAFDNSNYGKSQYHYAQLLVEECNLTLCALTEGYKSVVDDIFGINHTVVLKNGINLKKYNKNCLELKPEEVRNQLGISKDDFVLGQVARFSEEKNHIHTLSVFAELVKVKPDAKLLLVGDGDLKTKIINIAAEYNILKSTIFCGERNDVPQLLSIMDAFILPSLYEGLPLALLEAQAMEVKCVVSTAVSSENQISNQFVRIALEDPILNWVDAIVGHIGCQNCENQGKRSIEDSNIEKVINQVEKLYLGEI